MSPRPNALGGRVASAACVVLNGLRPTRRPQWYNGSLTALVGMCLAMWRSKHPTMTIRPELTVTPYQATSRHRSASVSAAGVGTR
eukprot:scaffold1364_cov116-Isochrysis_galbana.AAC.1